MITYIAAYSLIGGVLVLPALDDLEFNEIIPAILLWPINVIVTIVMMLKKEK
jgi:hypothetical protein